MKLILVIGLFVCLSACLIGAKLQEPSNELDSNSNLESSRKSTANQQKRFQDYDNNKRQRETNALDNRISVPEPYKSMVQSATRFALVSTEIGKRYDVERVMNFLNDLGYMLLKPEVLSSALKISTVIFGLLSLGIFFSPEMFGQLLERTWRSPDSFEFDLPLGYRMMVNEVLNLPTDEFMSLFGVTNNGCREKFFCYTGGAIRRIMPGSTEATVEFMRENFPNTKLPEGENIVAFRTGLLGWDCERVGYNETRRESCLSIFVRKSVNLVSDLQRKEEKKPCGEKRSRSYG